MNEWETTTLPGGPQPKWHGVERIEIPPGVYRISLIDGKFRISPKLDESDNVVLIFADRYFTKSEER